MEKINFESVVDGNAKETAQRASAGIAGYAAYGATASAVAAIGCGSAICTVGAPIVVGLAAATGAAKLVEWGWDLFF